MLPPGSDIPRHLTGETGFRGCPANCGCRRDRSIRHRLINSLAKSVDGRLARGPRSLAFAYVSFASWISRTLLPLPLQRRVRNSICSYGHK